MAVKAFRDAVTGSILNSWYSAGGWTRCLLPISVLFKWLAHRRYRRIIQSDRWQPDVPVVVVGNISVGGTGKSPVVAALVEAFRQKGFKPGVVSRGTGAAHSNESISSPLNVRPETNPSDAGDEPVMLAQALNVPVMVHPDRVLAAQTLIRDSDCDLVIAGRWTSALSIAAARGNSSH